MIMGQRGCFDLIPQIRQSTKVNGYGFSQRTIRRTPAIDPHFLSFPILGRRLLSASPQA